MDILYADTFLGSLGRLNANEQRVVKTTVFDLTTDPSRPSLRMHKLDRMRDGRFWSVSVTSDLRIIAHREGERMLLCFVDHHDRAYQWASRRRFEIHPVTGAAQLVEVREVAEERVSPQVERTWHEPEAPPAKEVEAPRTPGPPVLAGCTAEQLLGYGVPAEWVDEVLQADEDRLLEVSEHLPQEAVEAVLELATGGTPEKRQTGLEGADPFAHPDAQRRFFRIDTNEELERAFEFPWDRWMVFLHPDQRQWVEKDHRGPARVSGSAGTGKTIVALHRAVHLARSNPDAQVLLTTFSDPLARALLGRLRKLAGSEPRLLERIVVDSLDAVGLRLHRNRIGSVDLASEAEIADWIREAAAAVPGHGFSQSFLRGEWWQIVDARDLRDWESYRDTPRLGRRTRLAEQPRRVVWEIVSLVRSSMESAGKTTMAAVFHALARTVGDGSSRPWDFVVVDEAQDVAEGQLRFLAAIGTHRPDALFFAGDLGQRIFRAPFSWLSCGVDIRGRSRTLKVNYRTSHQIRSVADRLLDRQIADVDGVVEDRGNTVSVFNGPVPDIRLVEDESEEWTVVGDWLRMCSSDGMAPEELGVLVRSDGQRARAHRAVAAAGLSGADFDDRAEPEPGKVAVGTMHQAKGLEFRAVSLMACDEEVVPLRERFGSAGDPAELEEITVTERHLLYVATTRARERLLLTGITPGSEYLDDLRGR